MALNIFQRRKFMALPSDKNDLSYWFRNILSEKDMFSKLSQALFWKAGSSCLCICFIKKLLSKLLKVLRTLVVDLGFGTFLQSATILKIDPTMDGLLGLIFHKFQTNNCVTSPRSIPLNILNSYILTYT